MLANCPTTCAASLLAGPVARSPRRSRSGIGRDAAVIDNGGPKLLVAKTDPVTFASDLIGWYAVNVNANDIACMGAQPAWLMTTILLPDGAPAELAETIFDQVTQACEALGIELVGGHTEITYRLDRPIVVGALLGSRATGWCAPTEHGPATLILTKGIAIEGTAVLAREAADELRRAGMTPGDIDAGKAYIFEPGISVVKRR